MKKLHQHVTAATASEELLSGEPFPVPARAVTQLLATPRAAINVSEWVELQAEAG